MATPTIVNTVLAGAAATDSGGPASVTATVPNVQSDDWLLATVSGVYVAPAGLTVSGTWTDVGSALGNTGSNQHFLMKTFYQVAASPGSYTVTCSSANEKMVIVYHLRGCAAIDGVSGVATAMNSGNASQSAPEVAPSGSDNILLGFWGGIQFESSAYSYAAPSGMSGLVQTPAMSWTRLASASQVLTASGPTGARVATASLNPTSGSASRLVSIRGSSGGDPDPEPTGPEPGRFFLAVS